MYHLKTNEGDYYLTQDPKKYMMRYVKAKRAQGWKLSEIMFSWGPLRVSHNAESLVAAEERKAEAVCKSQ